MTTATVRKEWFPANLLLAVLAAVLAGCGGGDGGGGSSAALSGHTASATGVTWMEATLNGTVSPGDGPTAVWFEWGTDPSLTTCSTVTARTQASGSGLITADAALSGLTHGTTYYFRIAASDGKATRAGTTMPFTTLTVATVTTGSASAVSSSRATLNGDVNPGGLLATAWFEWGTDPGLSGCSSTPAKPVGAGCAPVDVAAAVTGLRSGTTYYYRIVSLNAAGVSRGAVTSFPALPVPSVATLAATDITDNAATLNGTVNPNGFATSAWFEWGTDPSFSSSSATAASGVGAGAADVAFSARVAGLSPDTKYYFRVAASNVYGTQRDAPADFNVYSDFFETAGSLGTGRVDHVTVLLASGEVLVAGGSGGSDNPNVVPPPEIFDSASGTFSAAGNLVTHRWWGHSGTRLADGRILIVGGVGPFQGGDNVVLASAELYDPVARSFSPTGGMSVPRAGHTATLLSDGTVLVAGGRAGDEAHDTAEVFNPASGSFGPPISMGGARNLHSATLLPDNTVLVAGGLDNAQLPLFTTAIYSPSSGMFAAGDNMVSMRQGHSAVRLPSGNVLLLGGGDLGPLAAAELYDPVTGRFSQTGGLAIPRDRGAFALLEDGRVLAAGGDVAGTSEIYDPAAGVFRQTASMQLPRVGHTATLLTDGSVLIVGGTDDSSIAVPQAERFR